jgi:hypothetical protein
MKKLLLAASMLTALALPANANLVLEDAIFADLGATGFGNAPRLLNIQNNGSEAGGTIYSGTPGDLNTSLATQIGVQTNFFTGLPPGTSCDANGGCNNQPQTQTDKSAVYRVSQLGWTTGQSVGIGLDTNETGANAALTFNSLVLTIWNSDGTNSISFSGSQPINIPKALLDLQQGNGNSVFNIGLDATQQAQFNAFEAANGGPANTFASLSASFGTGLPGQVCPGAGTVGGFASPAGCFGSTDGQESFLAFVQVPGPVVGAGIPGLVMALGGMLGLNRFRRKRHQTA